MAARWPGRQYLTQRGPIGTQLWHVSAMRSSPRAMTCPAALLLHPIPSWQRPVAERSSGRYQEARSRCVRWPWWCSSCIRLPTRRCLMLDQSQSGGA
jgi:hypothetical protein